MPVMEMVVALKWVSERFILRLSQRHELTTQLKKWIIQQIVVYVWYISQGTFQPLVLTRWTQ